MNQAVRFAVAGAVVLAVVAGVLLLRGRKPRAPAGASAVSAPPEPNATLAPLPVLATLPEFVLQDQDGRSYDLYELRGRVWVADFIFTRCAGTCPRITESMVKLADDVGKQPYGKNVRFVSFTVDPDHDSMYVLNDYAQRHHANLARWKFLRGTAGAIGALVRDGFRLPMADQNDPAMPINHSQEFVVVDRTGRVRGAFDALSEKGAREVRAAVAQLEAEPEPIDIYVPANVNSPPWLGPRMEEQVNNAQKIVAGHDLRFTDEIGKSGITFRHVASEDAGKLYRDSPYGHGSAVAVADVDGDGLPDLFFVNQAGKSALYRNLGYGRFEDITARAGVGIGDRACVGASFADIDNDGRPDLFVTCVRDGNLLFHNDGGGRFTNITASAGVEGTHGHSAGAVFFDYDGDGLLDLFVTNTGQFTSNEKRPDGTWASLPDAASGHLHPERLERSILYRNLGSGRFEDVTEKSGLTHSAWSSEATVIDFDNDGRPDLYILSMQGPDELWRNLGNGKFQNVTSRNMTRTPWGSMGVKVLDWNADGKPDIFVTDLNTDLASELRPDEEKRKHDPATMYPLSFLGTGANLVLGNALFTNRGGGQFLETSDYANVETGWPWGPSLGDLNADGYPDLFVTAGMNYPFRYHGNDILLNQGGNKFADAAYVLGAEPRSRLMRPWFDLDCDGADARHDICRGAAGPLLPGAPQPVTPWRGRVTVWAARASRSSAIVDLDNDGDLDVVTNDLNDIPQLLISDLAQRHPVNSVTVRLAGKRSNRDGIGATVTLKADGRSQVQWNDGKSGFLAQSVLPLYFGLGHAGHADAIEVKWPTGKVQVVKGPIQAGTRLVIEER
jgi:cytochrome oxidase Cu insertion factor (SCO1/SenC/PrrC family)